VASVRAILRNPAYADRALTNRTQVAPAHGRKSAMFPAGPGVSCHTTVSHAPRPEQDGIAVPVPPVISEQTFAQVQAKLDANQRTAARNTRHEYLLRAPISCGACRLTCGVRQTPAGYRYNQCRGRTDPLRVAQGLRCTARYIPAGQQDELVWADLCALVTDPTRPGRPRARPGARRRLAAPGTPRQADGHPPGPGPAGPPAAATGLVLPRLAPAGMLMNSGRQHQARPTASYWSARRS
jgi:site-specific DNA recombinase